MIDKTKRRTVVIAETRAQFLAYCRTKGIKPHDPSINYAHSNMHLIGCRDVDFVLTGTFRARHNFADMMESIDLCVKAGDCTVKEEDY